MKYETILFDADGTLLDFAASEREAVADALREIGVEADDAMIDAYSEINDSLWKKLERGEIVKSVLFYHRFELLFARYGIEADAHDAAKRYMEKLSRKGYLIEGAAELCRRLSQVARLYIVTNGTEFVQRGRLADSGLLPYFQDVFISDVIGAQKPRVEFFTYVAEHIPHFDRAKTLIVGDSLTSDMAGGIASCIDTCWYNPQDKEAPAEMEQMLTATVSDFDELESWIMKGETV